MTRPFFVRVTRAYDSRRVIVNVAHVLDVVELPDKPGLWLDFVYDKAMEITGTLDGWERAVGTVCGEVRIT